jgi:hypothetical protein
MAYELSPYKNINFHIQLFLMFVFLASYKNCLIRSCSSFKIYHHTQFYVLTLTSASFRSSKVLDLRYGSVITFNDLTCLQNFIKIC